MAARKKIAVGAYLKEAAEAIRPPENLKVSQWAERHRILDEKSSNAAGPWSNAITPYLVEIMDAYVDPDVEEIVFCKPTQVGGTEAANNIIGYIVGQNPGSILIVYPSDKLAKSISINRLKPMMKRSPQLRGRFHERQSSILEMQFDGMYITLTGADSPSSLASRPVGNLILDEVDKYPSASRKEASPIALARERTKTFPNRKIFITSTPTIKSGNIWSAMESADVIKHYFMPCPHCGEWITFDFKNLKWPSTENVTGVDRAEFAAYACPNCAAMITDREKPAMLRNGQWRAVKENAAVHRKVAFWINTLYSPFTRFSDIAREFILSKDDPERLQNFVNSWLAEPWEQARFRTSEEGVLSRRTDTPEGIVPDWAMMLTGGVDVQETSLYFTIRAWGPHLTSQTILYGQVNGFEDIEYVMNQEYKNAAGEPFLVTLTCVDSGDQTDDVYEFCISNGEWAIPSKGASHSIGRHYYKISTLQKPNLRLVLVDGGKYKDSIATHLHRDVGTGCFMCHAGTDEEYAKQLTAEHKVAERKNGRTVEKWALRTSHADNHYLDCEVYAFAAADVMGVRNLHLVEQGETEKTEPSPTQKKSAGWIEGGRSDERYG